MNPRDVRRYTVFHNCQMWRMVEESEYDALTLDLAYSENAEYDAKQLLGELSDIIADLDATLDIVKRERDTALRERDEARAWVADLQSGMYVNCVYCGYRYGRKEEVPESMADVLKAHVEKCPKHPMSLLKREYAKAKEALPILQELLDTHNEANPWLGVCAAATLRTNELTSLRSENTRLKAEMDNLVEAYLVWTGQAESTNPEGLMEWVESFIASRASRKSIKEQEHGQ